jgi:hypothetical protein
MSPAVGGANSLWSVLPLSVGGNGGAGEQVRQHTLLFDFR